MEMYIEMIIWAVIIAVALVVEYFTFDFTSIWFSVSGIVALILSACGVNRNIQIIVFLLISIVLVLTLRPICKRIFRSKTIPTNADANIGTIVKLMDATDDGKANIKINDVVWTAVCKDNLPKGAEVRIVGINGNKFIVEKFIKEENK